MKGSSTSPKLHIGNQEITPGTVGVIVTPQKKPGIFFLLGKTELASLIWLKPQCSRLLCQGRGDCHCRPFPPRWERPPLLRYEGLGHLWLPGLVESGWRLSTKMECRPLLLESFKHDRMILWPLCHDQHNTMAGGSSQQDGVVPSLSPCSKFAASVSSPRLRRPSHWYFTSVCPPH